MAASLVALYEELIIIALRAVRDIQQDRGIADGLLKSRHADIHCAARQMIARRTPASQPIHLRRTVTAGNDNRLVIWIQRIIRIPQILQPVLTEIPQILYHYPTRDIYKTFNPRFTLFAVSA